MERNPRSARTALVGYGSETGNAHDYAEELAQMLQRIRFDTRVAKLNAIDIVRISDLGTLSSVVK